MLYGGWNYLACHSLRYFKGSEVHQNIFNSPIVLNTTGDYTLLDINSNDSIQLIGLSLITCKAHSVVYQDSLHTACVSTAIHIGYCCFVWEVSCLLFETRGGASEVRTICLGWDLLPLKGDRKLKTISTELVLFHTHVGNNLIFLPYHLGQILYTLNIKFVKF